MKLDPNIYDKLIRFCCYRDRCAQEVVSKLRTLDVTNSEPYLEELIADDYLNEARFANSYAQGRFRMKYWGKQKIRAHLSAKRIPTELVTQALNAIDMEEYWSKAEALIARKYEDVKGKDAYDKKGKVYRYMAQKGFESPIISETIANYLEGLRDEELKESK